LLGNCKHQRTIGKSVSLSGSTLFSGGFSNIRLVPARAGDGIAFKRVDLPLSPLIPAKVEYVLSTNRCTKLGKEGATVQLVEHVLSALSGCGIDNCLIEVDGPEIPVGDGSAQLFVEQIEKAGVVELDALKKVIRIKEPLYFSDKDAHLIALPADHFQVSYTLHYPQSPFIRSQFFQCAPSEQFYRDEIASARTFCLYEEIAPLIEKGILKGGAFEQGLVIRGMEVLNVGGVRFPYEMAKHKVLDLIGDFTLLGATIEGHIVAIRSGHSTNVAFAKLIAQKENQP
jgi:UDP-3-O-[3-hydroxymyristoyl] N-acetylglucosamine deacetylase